MCMGDTYFSELDERHVMRGREFLKPLEGVAVRLFGRAFYPTSTNVSACIVTAIHAITVHEYFQIMYSCVGGVVLVGNWVVGEGV